VSVKTRTLIPNPKNNLKHPADQDNLSTLAKPKRHWWLVRLQYC